MFKVWKITVVSVVGVLFLLIWIFLFGISAGQPGSFYNKGHNAVWLGHEWVGLYKTEAQIQKLVEDFKKHDIDTVFVHSGPFESSGAVAASGHEFAVHFIDTAKRFDEGIEYQAWLGQLRGKVDLSNESVRHNMAKQAMMFTQLIGFDGVHFDIEPVWDGDTDFIEMLRESRELMPDDKKISVALAEFIPSSVLWLLENVKTFENYNTEVNYRNVAEYADQVVVMTYDTSLDKDWKYIWLVMEETIRVTNLLDETEVFIGLPAYEYDEKKEWFDPEIENVENGLKGVIKGLNNFRSEVDNFAGVAIYPFWEIDNKEWDTYDTLWLK